MKNRYIKSVLILNLLSVSLYAEQILMENSWVKIGYSNAKDAMVSGATTATGKGYSALYTNPAGLSTNYALGLNIGAATIEHKNSTGSTNDDNSLTTTKQTEMIDNSNIALFYKGFIINIKPKVHKAIGYGYGFETSYGLVSLGFNYVKDDTTVDNYRDFGTGDYYTLGLQWQKSYIGLDDFYAFYAGFSKKGQGVRTISGEQVGNASPIVQKIGLGIETNMFSSTILLSLDMTQQTWTHITDSLDTQAVGLKWMMFDGFSLGLGASQSTYNTDVDLDSATTLSVGFEFAAWKTNVAIAAVQKEVQNKAGKVYSQDDSIHADISFAF